MKSPAAAAPDPTVPRMCCALIIARMGSQPVSDEELLRLIESQAMEVMALPIAEREARYMLIKDSYRESAKKLGMSVSQAAAFGAKMELWVRTLVRIIEGDGDASAGRV
jgi:hypothetical protein